MKTLELLDDRTISGKGVIRIPTDDEKSRYYLLYLDLVRPPRNSYLSTDWNPNRSAYARFTYLRSGYVLCSDIMYYPRERRLHIADISGQVLRAVKCSYEGTLQTFVNFAVAQGLPVISVENKIKDFKSLNLGWREVRFVCIADTAIQVRIFALDYDVCNEENDDEDELPEPPPPRPRIPAGTPIADISQPYNPTTNDDGNSVPDDLDEFEPSIYAVTAQYIASTNCAIPNLSIIYYFGEVPEFTNLGNPICGGDKYRFNPAPFGFDEGAGFRTPTPGALFDGSSNYVSFSSPVIVPDPR